MMMIIIPVHLCWDNLILFIMVLWNTPQVLQLGSFVYSHALFP